MASRIEWPEGHTKETELAKNAEAMAARLDLADRLAGCGLTASFMAAMDCVTIFEAAALLRRRCGNCDHFDRGLCVTHIAGFCNSAAPHDENDLPCHDWAPVVVETLGEARDEEGGEW